MGENTRRSGLVPWAAWLGDFFSVFKKTRCRSKGREKRSIFVAENKLATMLKKIGFGLLVLGLSYIGILLFPTILFAHKVEYRQCVVYSDNLLPFGY